MRRKDATASAPVAHTTSSRITATQTITAASSPNPIAFTCQTVRQLRPRSPFRHVTKYPMGPSTRETES
jgi:hypothetical protein